MNKQAVLHKEHQHKPRQHGKGVKKVVATLAICYPPASPSGTPYQIPCDATTFKAYGLSLGGDMPVSAQIIPNGGQAIPGTLVTDSTVPRPFNWEADFPGPLPSSVDLTLVVTDSNGVSFTVTFQCA